jgi:hypothetical protein
LGCAANENLSFGNKDCRIGWEVFGLSHLKERWRLVDDVRKEEAYIGHGGADEADEKACPSYTQEISAG